MNKQDLALNNLQRLKSYKKKKKKKHKPTNQPTNQPSVSDLVQCLSTFPSLWPNFGVKKIPGPPKHK